MGAHFEALDEGVLMAVLKSFENFFAISKLDAALLIGRNLTETLLGMEAWGKKYI